MKKSKKTKTVYTVTIGGYEKKSEHTFDREFRAWTFYQQIKFALEFLDDDWAYVLSPTAKEVPDESF